MILPAVPWAPMMACSDSDCEFVMVKYYVITQERKEEFIFPNVPALRRLHSAVARMNLCPDIYSPDPANRGYLLASLSDMTSAHASNSWMCGRKRRG